MFLARNCVKLFPAEKFFLKRGRKGISAHLPSDAQSESKILDITRIVDQFWAIFGNENISWSSTQISMVISNKKALYLGRLQFF